MDEKYGVVATPVLHLMKKSIKRMFILLIIFITLFVISVIDSIYQRCRVIGILESIEVVEETVTEQYEMNADGTMSQVYESGSDFEKIISEIDELAPYFNCSNDDEEGPEAESVTVGEIDGKTYAFIGLERIGGIMVYDITDPENPEYVNYINSRSFGTDEDLIDGDNSPEGLVFIPADESLSGNAELIAAFEVSGTAGIFELTAAADTDEPADSDEPSDTDEPADSDEPADTDESADSAEDETPADTEIDAESDVQADAQEDVQEDAQETDEAPVKTGDAQNILNWIAVMAVSVLGAVILKFRKVQEK